MKDIIAKIKSPKLSIPIIVIGVAILFSGAMIFGTFDKFFIKRTFEKAFFYRAVGNCDAFIEYMATDKDKWLDRCLKEKKREETIPIKDFEVLRVNYIGREKKAFLQVQLTREERAYTVNYEMVKQGLKWKIANEI